jgi:autotransporter adhesin
MATASGSNSLSAGVSSLASADRAAAVGAEAKATADNSLALGFKAQASAAQAVAIGSDSVSQGVDSVAIGKGAVASTNFSVALGSGSSTRLHVAPAAVVLNGKTYTFDSRNLNGVVSVGGGNVTRQIINVGPGVVSAQSQDAVNGSQLFAAYDAINTLGSVDKTLQAAVDQGVRDVAATRASQTAATASVAEAIGGGASVDGEGRIVMPKLELKGLGSGQPQPTTLLDSVKALDTAIKNQEEAVAVVSQVATEADRKANIALRQLDGFEPNETVAGRIDEVKRNSLQWDPSQGVYNATNASGAQHRISNLAAGQVTTDAVNKGQLDQAVADLKALGAGLLQESDGQLRVGKDSTATTVNLAGSTPQRDAAGNPVLDADGQAVTTPVDRQLAGVADGVNGNDAVNKQQLDKVAEKATQAQSTATGAQQVAAAAQGAATGAQKSADAANTKLEGIGDGETVAGRIAQAAQAATDAAGRAASQSLADALGGGSTVGADGKPSAPAYGVSQIGADGKVAAQKQTAGNVGDALAAVDANVIKVNERVLAQDAKVGGLTQDLAALRSDSLLWDEQAGAFSAAHGADAPNKIVNVAAGVAATDAVNKGQLDTVEQTATTAQRTAESAQSAAGAAQTTAASAQQTATAAQSTAAGAQEVAKAAQDTAQGAQQVAQGAQTTAMQAQQTAGAAQGAATGAQEAATAAQTTARAAQQAAVAAQGTANGAQQAATAAQGTATGAQRTADAAQVAATSAQQSANAANAKLAGIGEGETVAGRIEQAARDAADAAGRTAGQSLADALGGGSTMGADGKPSAPTYSVSQIGADGAVAAQKQTANNVGDALAAVDANVVKVNDRVLAQDTKVAGLTQDLSDLRSDSLLWDQGAGAFSAAHGADAPNRIVNLAAGQAASDAVNKGQLDQAVADLKAQGAGLLQERDGQLQVGTSSAATTVNLAGSAPQRDADGNPVLDASGNAVMAPVNRTLTGVADGVNSNDAVNKAQLDGVAQTATAAQGAAGDAKRAADAAQGTAAGAQEAATAAQGTATGAQRTADAAQVAATSAQQSANAANAKLAGIGEGETVAGRIEQAARDAADAAGRTAGQSLADALGGGSTMGADGKPSAPTYSVSQIGADGAVAAQKQTANNVGDALAAVDANVVKVNDRVLAQDTKVAGLTQDLSDLRSDSLLWDQGAGAFSAAHGADAPNRIVNLAAGQAASDAVNKGQLDTVAQVADTAQSDATKAQQSAETAQGSATQAQQAAQTAQGAASDAQRSADAANAKLAGIGDGETVAGRIDQAAQKAGQSLADALGGGATVRADGTVQGPSFTVTAIGPGGSVNPQPGPAGNVSDAIKAIDGSVVAVNDNVNKVGADVSTMRDQLNTGQLGLVRQDATTRDITVARQTDGTRVTLEGTAGARTLSGVKAGEVSGTSTEAVVGSQLFTVNQDLLKNSQAVGNLEVLTGQQGVALGALSDLVGSGNVGLTRHDPSSNTVSLAADRGGNTVDVSGKDGVRQVTGLQDGRIQAGSTDAVTGGQMNAVTERINRLDVQGASVAIDSQGNGSDRAVAAPGSRGVAVGTNARAQGTNSVATGAGANAQGANSSAMGAGASAQAAGSTAIGANASASAPGSVAIGEGAQATRANTVSVGSAGAERQITHVAPATQDTDAVNLRQTVSISRQEAGLALEQANRYTDSRIGQLRSETNAGIASAMAMAALPSTSTPGKSMLSMGTSLYGGQSAIAMGLSGRSQNGVWMYRASSSTTKDGEIGAAVGVGYEW